MAPEQLEAQAADERADLWALGAILYEMVTGRRAFEGKSDAGLMAAILDHEPAPIASLQPQVPPALEQLVRQCLAKSPADRPDTAYDVATSLRWIRESIGAGAPAGLRLPQRFALRPARVLAAAVVLALAAVVWQYRGLPTREAAPKQAPAAQAAVTIAVLPFSDLSANHDQEYFSDGLAEELLNALGRVPGLRVTARVSSFRFKGANPDAETIGRKLNVANLLEGSVRRDGRRLRIGVRLVDARNGFQRWSAAYERQMDDIFAVQEDIARAVVAALQITLLESAASIVALQTKNPEAYNAVLQARHFWTRRGQGDLERAAASFRKAIELDPGYANAWVGLAETHHRQADNGELPVEEGYRMARQEVERALALAPGLAYAHAEMGWIKRAHDWDWEGADAAYQQALALEPGSRAAVVGASVLAFTLGRLDEAVGLDARAIELDPLSVGPRINLGIHQYYAGRLDEAAKAFTKALELNPEYPITRAMLGRVLLMQGRPHEALAEIEREPDEVWRRYGLCLAYHAAGRAQEADTALAAFVKDYKDTMAFQNRGGVRVPRGRRQGVRVAGPRLRAARWRHGRPQEQPAADLPPRRPASRGALQTHAPAALTASSPREAAGNGSPCDEDTAGSSRREPRSPGRTAANPHTASAVPIRRRRSLRQGRPALPRRVTQRRAFLSLAERTVCPAGAGDVRQSDRGLVRPATGDGARGLLEPEPPAHAVVDRGELPGVAFADFPRDCRSRHTDELVDRHLRDAAVEIHGHPQGQHRRSFGASHDASSAYTTALQHTERRLSEAPKGGRGRVVSFG